MDTETGNFETRKGDVSDDREGRPIVGGRSPKCTSSEIGASLKVTSNRAFEERNHWQKDFGLILKPESEDKVELWTDQICIGSIYLC